MKTEIDKTTIVKNFFENSTNYLKNNFNIIIRKELVNCLLQDRKYETILDIASGDGSVSFPLLKPGVKLTLIDISSDMLLKAKENITGEFYDQVNFINGDFLKSGFENKNYDVIICLGLLAHINEPERTIEKISFLLKSDGIIVLQNTDSGHFYFKLIKLSEAIKRLFRKNAYGYEFNEISNKGLEKMFERYGLKISRRYRYNQSFLLFSRLLPSKFKYKFIKFIFGSLNNNRFAFLGCENIYFLEKEHDSTLRD